MEGNVKLTATDYRKMAARRTRKGDVKSRRALAALSRQKAGSRGWYPTPVDLVDFRWGGEYVESPYGTKCHNGKRYFYHRYIKVPVTPFYRRNYKSSNFGWMKAQANRKVRAAGKAEIRAFAGEVSEADAEGVQTHEHADAVRASGTSGRGNQKKQYDMWWSYY